MLRRLFALTGILLSLMLAGTGCKEDKQPTLGKGVVIDTRLQPANMGRPGGSPPPASTPAPEPGK
jgi:hypothetical protein